MTTRVPSLLTWHICQIVVDFPSLVVNVFVLNQYKEYWLLSDAFHFAISMNLKLREKPKNAQTF